MHEQELPNALAVDSEGNFERLVLIYQDQLYAFALCLTGNPYDAEDILVDAFVRAYQALGQYRRERIQAMRLRAWLYQITRNVFRNRVRGKRLPFVSGDQADAAMWPEIEDHAARRPDAILERTELRQRLGTLVQELPEREREAVVLRHVEGLGYRDIAAILERPVGTVKAHVHRGIRRLREALTTYEEWR